MDDLFDEQISCALRNVLALREYLQDLGQLEYPTAGSVHLVVFFRRLTYFYEAALEALSDKHQIFRGKNPPPSVTQSLENQIRAIREEVREVAKSTRLIESSQVGNSLVDVPAIFETLAHTIRSTLSIVVRPQNDYQYQYAEPISERLKGTQPILRELPHKRFTPASLGNGISEAVGIISFPKIERSNVLQHAFWLGHELGHFIDDVCNLTKVSGKGDESVDEPHSPFIQFNTKAVADLCDRIKMYAVNAETAVLETRTEVSQKASRWLKELACDVVSANLNGPAAITSFLHLALGEPSLDFTLPEDDDEAGPGNLYYPWLRLRLRVMFASLEANGFAFLWRQDPREIEAKFAPFCDALRRAHKLAEQVVTQPFDAERLKKEAWPEATDRKSYRRRKALEVTRIVAETVQRAFPSVFHAADARRSEADLLASIRGQLALLTVEDTAPWSYMESDYGREVKDLVDNLEKGIPPVQFMRDGAPEAARFASILCAAWIHALSHNLTSSRSSTEDGWRRLNAQIAYALEANQVQRRFALERRNEP